MPRIRTATVAADRAKDSRPVEMVVALAVTRRLSISAVAGVNCALNVSARSGAIIAAARSTAAPGSEGLNVAVASETSLAMRATSMVSREKSRSAAVQRV